MGSELHRLVEQSIDALSGERASILRLHLFEQCGPEQIATRLGISPGNARVRLHRARAALREDLGRRLGPGHECPV
jgi:RNA polymerase sigma-70 factor (ECF subfamily)